MSQENVEVTRASFEGFNRDGYLPEELWTHDAELRNISESPIPGPYRGYEGLRRWRTDICEVVEEASWEIEELIDADSTQAVLARVRLQGIARHSGLDIDRPFTVVNWFREGRIYRSDAYSEHQEALEAAGLSE